MRSLSRTYWNPFYLLKGSFKCSNEEKCQGNRKKRFCSMLYIALATSRSTRGASHQPAFMDSCLTINPMCLPCLPSRWVSRCAFEERRGSSVCYILLWLNPQPVFMDSCLTISHMCLPCLPSRWVSPYVLCPLFIELMVVLLTFFWVWFQFYGNMLLCSGMGMEFKDKVMLHCFREMGCQQGFTTGIWY